MGHSTEPRRVYKDQQTLFTRLSVQSVRNTQVGIGHTDTPVLADQMDDAPEFVLLVPGRALPNPGGALLEASFSIRRWRLRRIMASKVSHQQVFRWEMLD